MSRVADIDDLPIYIINSFVMKVLTTPWKDNLLKLVSTSKKSIKITSPYVKENICNEIFSAKKNNTKLELITSFKLMSIYSGSLDISAIEMVIANNGIVKTFAKLHSKIYIFDDTEVIITSGNLTNGGLLNNYEYGIYSKDSSLVSKVVTDFNTISKNENTGNIKQTDIDTVRKILARIPEVETIKFPKFKIENTEENFAIIEIPEKSITSSLTGWKLEVFKCINSIPKQVFTLTDINSFQNKLKAIYPSNQYIKDKIRQQLQYLRNLGLIEFLGNGKYKKLWI